MFPGKSAPGMDGSKRILRCWAELGISQVLAGTKISPIYSQTSLINKKKVYENYPVRIVRNVPGNVGLRQ